jgi:hypothetical protein
LKLNYLETNQYTFSTRWHSLQPSASRNESVRLSQKAARYCLCYRQSIELLPTQDIFTIVELASAPGNHPSTAARALESQLVTYSARSLNSK